MLIRSVFIDSETYPHVWFQIVFGPYTNLAYKFAFPQDCGRLWQGCQLVVTTCWHQLIDFIYLKYPSFSSHYPIIVYCWILFIAFTGAVFVWPWNLPLGVIENYLWAVYKPYIWICFPCRLVEVCGKDYVCVVSLVITNWFTRFKAIISRFW